MSTTRTRTRSTAAGVDHTPPSSSLRRHVKKSHLQKKAAYCAGGEKVLKNLNSECSWSLKECSRSGFSLGGLWNATLATRGFSRTIPPGWTGGSHEPYRVGEPECSQGRPRGRTRRFPWPTTSGGVRNVFRTPIGLDSWVYRTPFPNPTSLTHS